jgi:hypothetical protein
VLSTEGVEYYSWTTILPTHLSSHKIIFQSSLIINGSYEKKIFFIAMRDHNPHVPIDLGPCMCAMCFPFTRVCQRSSSWSSLSSYLLRRALFFTSRSWIWVHLDFFRLVNHTLYCLSIFRFLAISLPKRILIENNLIYAKLILAARRNKSYSLSCY